MIITQSRILRMHCHGLGRRRGGRGRTSMRNRRRGTRGAGDTAPCSSLPDLLRMDSVPDLATSGSDLEMDVVEAREEEEEGL